jgi:hypothetical protein
MKNKKSFDCLFIDSCSFFEEKGAEERQGTILQTKKRNINILGKSTEQSMYHMVHLLIQYRKKRLFQKRQFQLKKFQSLEVSFSTLHSIFSFVKSNFFFTISIFWWGFGIEK